MPPEGTFKRGEMSRKHKEIQIVSKLLVTLADPIKAKQDGILLVLG